MPNQQSLWNCIAICGSCNGPICFIAMDTAVGTNMQPGAVNGSIEPRFSVAQIWPSRIASSAPPHTPESVKRRFIEGENAFRQHSWNAAVAMYRSALDIATKAIPDVPRSDFYKRLQWLSDNHKITPEIRSWGDAVRIEGNASLHDPDDFTEEDARPLRLFTEMFLRYVFELPGEVRAFRGELNPGPA